MLVPPEWRNRLTIGGAVAVAILVGAQVAGGSIAWPALVAGTMVAIMIARVQPVHPGALVVGLVLFGYMVGNRGFAQLSLAGGLPLLPAEFALAAGLGFMVFRSAIGRHLPFRRDLLNTAILLWIAVGTIRVVVDIRRHGFFAVRDYALVYYAIFFFIAQYLAENEKARRFLLRCIYAGGLTVLLLQPFYALYPEFFYTQLVFRGIPLILYKGDLLATSLAITSLLYFQLYEARRRIWWLLVSLAALVPVLTTNNRATLLGLFVGTAFLALGRRWRFAGVQLGLGVVAALVVVVAAAMRNKPLESTPVYEFYERIVSIADPSGSGSYRGENTSYKGDNNAFRTVWWTTAINETIETNPWVGLGFGHDLAARFLERYYPSSDDDFTVRSPHNVVVTVFARMGLVGLLFFAAIIFLVVQGTITAVRRPLADILPASLWCSALVIFTSACFGVVLEGPMGAMLFWTLLGLAHHATSSDELAPAEASPPDAVSAEHDAHAPATGPAKPALPPLR